MAWTRGASAVEEPDLLFSCPPPDATQPFFTRHGFVNSGNLCYVNSTLQALLACTGFYALLQALRLHDERARLPPSFSTLRCLVDLGAEFAPRSDEPSSSSPHFGRPCPVLSSDQLLAAPLEAFERSRNVAGSSAVAGKAPRPSATRRSRPQQDAHEFLTFLLDSTHSELLLLKQRHSAATAPPQTAAEEAGSGAGDEEAWVSVGRKNRTAVTRTHEALREEQESPVTQLFGGAFASVVTHRGAKPSKTLDPFQVISLEVTDARVLTVGDALASFFGSENLEEFKDARGAMTSARLSTRLDRVPRVLVLHMKIFGFSDSGHKILKRLQFGEHLTLERSMYEGRDGRQYRLAAVVEHIGDKRAFPFRGAALRALTPKALRSEHGTLRDLRPRRGQRLVAHRRRPGSPSLSADGAGAGTLSAHVRARLTMTGTSAVSKLFLSTLA